MKGYRGGCGTRTDGREKVVTQCVWIGEYTAPWRKENEATVARCGVGKEITQSNQSNGEWKRERERLREIERFCLLREAHDQLDFSWSTQHQPSCVIVAPLISMRCTLCPMASTAGGTYLGGVIPHSTWDRFFCGIITMCNTLSQSSAGTGSVSHA